MFHQVTEEVSWQEEVFSVQWGDMEPSAKDLSSFKEDDGVTRSAMNPHEFHCSFYIIVFKHFANYLI